MKRAACGVALLLLGAAGASVASTLDLTLVVKPATDVLSVTVQLDEPRRSSTPLSFRGAASFMPAFVENLEVREGTARRSGDSGWTASGYSDALEYSYCIPSKVHSDPSLFWHGTNEYVIYTDPHCCVIIMPFLLLVPEDVGVDRIRLRIDAPVDWRTVTPYIEQGGWFVSSSITDDVYADFIDDEQIYMGMMRFYAEDEVDGCTIRFGKLEADSNDWEVRTQEEVDAYVECAVRSTEALTGLFGSNPYEVFLLHTNFKRCVDGTWFEWMHWGGRNGWQYWPEHRRDELVCHMGLAWSNAAPAPLVSQSELCKGMIEVYYGQTLAYELFQDPSYLAKQYVYYLAYEWMRENRYLGTMNWAQSDDEYEIYIRWNVISLLLDRKIQERSSGGSSLDDAVRWLYGRYADTSHMVTIHDLQTAIEQACGVEIGDIFSRYVYGREKLPVYDEYIAPYKGHFENYSSVLRDTFKIQSYQEGSVVPFFVDIVLGTAKSKHVMWAFVFEGYSLDFWQHLLAEYDPSTITLADFEAELSSFAGHDCTGILSFWESSYGVLTIDDVRAWLKPESASTSIQSEIGEGIRQGGTGLASTTSGGADFLDGIAGREWDSALSVIRDQSGDTSNQAGDLTELHVYADESFLYARIDTAGTPSPGIRYSVNLHPVGSSDCYSIHTGGDGMYGPNGWVCDVDYAIGDVIEVRVPRSVLGGLQMLYFSADSRPHNGSWEGRFDDTQRKSVYLK